MRNLQNIRIRNGIYSFRRKVPRDIQAFVRPAEIILTLATSHPQEARRRAHAIWLITERIFAVVRMVAGEIDEAGDLVGPDQVKKFVDTMIENSSFNDAYLDADPDFQKHFSIDRYLLQLEFWMRDARRKLNNRDISSMKTEIQQLAQQVGVPIEPDSRNEKIVGLSLLRAEAEYFENTAGRERKDRGIPENSPLTVFARSCSLDLLRENVAALVLNEASVFTKFIDPSQLQVAPQQVASQPTQQAPTVRNGHELFEDAWMSFKAEQVLGEKWTSAVARQNTSTLKLFLAICGNKPVSEYQVSDGRAFRKVLLGLPANYSKDRRYRKTYLAKGPRGVVEMTAGDDDIERMTSKTFNRHLAAVSTFWDFAKLGAMIAPDAPSIFSGLHIPIKKGRKSPIQSFEERPIWSKKLMRAMFASNLFYGCEARNKWRHKGDLVFRDERYWGVLMGPHQGLRREELFQLKVKHIRYEPTVEIWYVDLFSKELRLKDSGSPRYVPLHKNILELGFIEARVKGRRSDDFLFPEATPSAVDKKRGDYFGKFFHHFRSDIIDRMDDNEPFDPSDVGDIDNGTRYEDMVYHAARHTVATLLYRAGVPIPHCEEFIGHESSDRRSEFWRYNKGQTLQMLKAAVDKIVLPIDLDAHKAAIRKSEGLNQASVWPALDKPVVATEVHTHS